MFSVLLVGRIIVVFGFSAKNTRRNISTPLATSEKLALGAAVLLGRQPLRLGCCSDGGILVQLPSMNFRFLLPLVSLLMFAVTSQAQLPGFIEKWRVNLGTTNESQTIAIGRDGAVLVVARDESPFLSSGRASVPGDSFDTVPDVHLLADVFDVGSHGFQTDAQLVADLFVDVAGG